MSMQMLFENMVFANVHVGGGRRESLGKTKKVCSSELGEFILDSTYERESPFRCKALLGSNRPDMHVQYHQPLMKYKRLSMLW